MPPDQLLGMVIAKHETPILGAAFTLPQPGGLPYLQYDRRGRVVKPALDHFPVQPQSQQFLKHAFRCHAPTLQAFHRKQRRTPDSGVTSESVGCYATPAGLGGSSGICRTTPAEKSPSTPLRWANTARIAGNAPLLTPSAKPGRMGPQ